MYSRERFQLMLSSSFVMGTSATLFNGAFLELNGTDSGLLTNLITAFLADLGEDQADISRIPNTFSNYNSGENPIYNLTYITLVDAGETNQNIPLEPLLVPTRDVDAIVAFDSSYDTDYIWPNGTALRTTYERAKVLAEHENTRVLMPEVPSMNGFVNGGYNSTPTFFGCNDTTTPLIIYVPSYPWSFAANTSTVSSSYHRAKISTDDRNSTNFRTRMMKPTKCCSMVCALSLSTTLFPPGPLVLLVPLPTVPSCTRPRTDPPPVKSALTLGVGLVTTTPPSLRHMSL